MPSQMELRGGKGKASRRVKERCGSQGAEANLAHAPPAKCALFVSLFLSMIKHLTKSKREKGFM